MEIHENRMSTYISFDDYHRLIPLEPYYEAMQTRMIDFFRANRLNGDPILIRENGAGTGTFTKKLAALPNVEVEAVEPDERAFAMLGQNLTGFQNVTFHHASSTHFKGRTAAYVFSSFVDHHIPPSEKLDYFRQIRENLSPVGMYLAGDIFLRPHDSKNESERRNAVNAWYDHIVQKAKTTVENPIDSAALISIFETSRSGDLEQNGEFKISNGQYEALLDISGFHYSKFKIGPLDRDDVGGVYVYRARPLLLNTFLTERRKNDSFIS